METKRKVIKYILLGLFPILLFSCGNEENNNKIINDANNEQNIVFSGKKIISPSNGGEFTIGDTIIIESQNQDSVNLDSVVVFLDANRVSVFNAEENIYSIETKGLNTGKHIFGIESWYKGENNRTDVSLFFKSDIVPIQYKAKIVNTYSHSTKSYTQGLLFDNGQLYEGTGQWGESALKKVELETGKILDEHILPAEVFGEGIVSFEGEFIQLTWKARKAYVINKKDLSLIKSFSYDTDGWGITNYGKNIIMSDGSHKLYIVEPNTFTVTKQIEVFDDKKAVVNLNELEYIDGKIYANVYLAHNIVIINPETGKVEGNIDLTDIIPQKYLNENDNVLNGIAYKPENKKLYITGKRWDKLYEIELVKIN